MIAAAILDLPPLPFGTRSRDGHRPAAVPPLVAVLGQLEDLIGGMTDEQYCQKPAGLSASVGGHVRHCLDHVTALLAAIERGTLDYDQRQRGTDVETSRLAALEVIRLQTSQLLDVPSRAEGWPLRLSAIVSSTSPAVEMDTTVGRELAFVLSHTIHHNSLIGVMAKALGVPVPERFGYAPSTIAHLEKTR